MTPISDEMLMAYADGELEADDALRVSTAIDADPELAARHQAHQRLRLRMRRAYGSALQEEVPERLLETARTAAGAAVVDLAAHRAARAMPLPPAATAEPQRVAPGWTQWGGLAASLAIGIVIGSLLDFARHGAADFDTTPQGLAARGAVADALSTRVAAAAGAGDAVRLQISFVDRDGNYCRTFSTSALAGLACRDGTQWMVRQLQQVTPGATSEMRRAAVALPAELLASVERRMQGDPLDAAAEKAALARGWER